MSDAPQTFAGIAPKMVQASVPAVLAMQYRVTVKAAAIFFKVFFHAISRRESVDFATQCGRFAIASTLGVDNREFATPTLYMRAKEASVF